MIDQTYPIVRQLLFSPNSPVQCSPIFSGSGIDFVPSTRLAKPLLNLPKSQTGLTSCAQRPLFVIYQKQTLNNVLVFINTWLH
jgi:hypothetical protein